MKAESLSDWASKKRSVGAQPRPTKGDIIEICAYDRKTEIAIFGHFAQTEATLHPKGWRHFAARLLRSLRKSLRALRNNPPTKDSYLWR